MRKIPYAGHDPTETDLRDYATDRHEYVAHRRRSGTRERSIDAALAAHLHETGMKWRDVRDALMELTGYRFATDSVMGAVYRWRRGL